MQKKNQFVQENAAHVVLLVRYEQRCYNCIGKMSKVLAFYDKGEIYVVFVAEDWRTPFMEYLA